jgi:hypothetical protein
LGVPSLVMPAGSSEPITNNSDACLADIFLPPGRKLLMADVENCRKQVRTQKGRR